MGLGARPMLGTLPCMEQLRTGVYSNFAEEKNESKLLQQHKVEWL